MEIKDEKFLIPVSELTDVKECEFDLTLTEEEKKAFSNVKELESCICHLKCLGTDDYVSLFCDIECSAIVYDAVTQEEIDLTNTQDVSLVYSSDNEVSELTSENGFVDLRPVYLALLFAAIPLDFSVDDVDYEEE